MWPSSGFMSIKISHHNSIHAIYIVKS